MRALRARLRGRRLVITQPAHESAPRPRLAPQGRRSHGPPHLPHGSRRRRRGEGHLCRRRRRSPIRRCRRVRGDTTRTAPARLWHSVAGVHPVDLLGRWRALWSRLHAAWPHSAWCVFDGSLTFTKAPRELLDLAFDVPLERIPSRLRRAALPPGAGGGAGVRRSVCHPGHIIHVAERLAALKRMEAPLDAMRSPALMGAAASMQSASVTPTGELMPPPPPTTTVAAAEGVKVTPQRGHVVGPVEFCLAAARENARIVFPELRLKAIDVTPKAEQQQPPLRLPQELHPPRATGAAARSFGVDDAFD